MNTAIINFTTEPKLKAEAQRVAKKIGIPLSLALNNYLKHLVKTKSVTFREEIPNEYFKRTLAKARKDFKEGKGSPVFHTNEEMMKWFKEQGI